MERAKSAPLFVFMLILGISAMPSVAGAASRGGWPDLPWTYIYDARLGQDVAGAFGGFDDLDGSWDDDNLYSQWFGDSLSDTAYPLGVEAFVRAGQGDNEGGTEVVDAETLSIADLGESQSNNRIYFERFLTTGGDTGGGSPLIDFSRGLTAICRFRFFSIDDLKADETLRRSLGIQALDDAAINSADTQNAGNNEYDEGPREMEGTPNGMFQVTQAGVHAAIGYGAGGLYWGVDVDGDDSWDPSTVVSPPPAGSPVGVKVAFIVRGPNNANMTYQMSDKRIVDRLRARGMTVTVLDHGQETSPGSGILTGGHISYVSTINPAKTGPEAVALDHDLVIISSTVGAGNVGYNASQPRHYAPYDTSIIMWESGLGVHSRGYGLATDGGTVFYDNRLNILSNAHPITTGLFTGTQAIFYGAVTRRMSYVGYSVPGTDLGVHPDLPTMLHGLVAYDAPVDLPNRRMVFLPLEDDTFWALNSAGMTIFDQAVEWALGSTKAALLAARPPVPPAPPEPAAWKRSFYINLGATPRITSAGQTMHTRVLKGSFFRDLSSADPTVPAFGGDTKVWAELPGSLGDFLSVYITCQPESSPPPGAMASYRVKVFFNGSSTPVIEIQNHHLDPAITAAVGNGGANDGTGMAMGLWRPRAAGFLDVDYFGVHDGAVAPPGGCNTPPADLNGDGFVDGNDFGIFGGCFNGSGNPITCGEPCADLDNDGDVDGSDFGIFGGCFNGTGNTPNC